MLVLLWDIKILADLERWGYKSLEKKINSNFLNVFVTNCTISLSTTVLIKSSEIIETLKRNIILVQFSSFQFSHSVMSNSLQLHGLQHARPPCPSPTPRAYSNSCPLSQWCPPTISSFVIPFSSCLQFFPVAGSFPMSQFFPSGGQTIGLSASTSVLPMYIQDWFPLGWTGWISLQSKGLSGVFSNNTVQKHQFFSPQLSL